MDIMLTKIEKRGYLGRRMHVAMLVVVIAVQGCSRAGVEVPDIADVAASSADIQPNILVILADDLGYSDIGPFGAEIQTPTLDALAAEGMVLTNFRVHTMCSPTRAMLLTGLDSHRVGYGTMSGEYTDATRGQPGYEARLDPKIETLGNRLQRLGYRTFIAGKWDMGGRGNPDLWPIRRGFDNSWVLIEGSASHFGKQSALAELPSVTYVANDSEIELPNNFYSSDVYADKAIEFIDAHGDKTQPFFGYLSFTAPHYPLQAPDDYIARYAGQYDEGYEAVRNARVKRMRETGIIGVDEQAAPRHPVWPSWEKLPDKIRMLESRRMEIYAAMIESMDHNIGRVVEHLKSTGQWENTVVLFFSDNGPEGGNPLDWGGEPWFDWAENSFDTSLENMGRANSYVWAGPGWAYVSATPFRDAKGFTTEGGIRSPMIITWPGHIKAGATLRADAHILDLMPTIMAMAGDDRGHESILGRSMLPALTGDAANIHGEGEQFGLELLGRRALILGNWKITWNNAPWGRGEEWSLFNLATDPTEIDDVADQHPEKLAELVAAWEKYAQANGVIPIPVYPMGNTNSFTHYKWLPPSMRQGPAAD